MPRGYKITQEEAAAKIADRSYVFLGEYKRKDQKVLVRCEIHGFEKEVIPGHLFRGAVMACCNAEKNSQRGKALVGEKNPFFGKKHSAESREKMSATTAAGPHPLRGLPQPKYLADALMAANKGRPRPEHVKRRAREFMLERSKCFGYCVRKVRSGKTFGRQGWFYVVRIGDRLKLGSATTTMNYRLVRHRQTHGPDVELLFQCLVDNCGEYEAMMMERNRDHWISGEFFHNFLAA